MVNFKELKFRIRDFLRFDQKELFNLLLISLAAAFIFSFNDWGAQTFNLATGLTNLFLLFIASIIIVLFRFTLQKIYALSLGYKATFGIWYNGLLYSLIIVFFTLGRLPLIMMGKLDLKFLSKQRIGEKRYGFSYVQNAYMEIVGPFANLLIAIPFAIFSLAFPQSYFFANALQITIFMGFFSFLPFNNLGGLAMFFGSRPIYYTSIIAYTILALLLMAKLKASIIAVIIIVFIFAIIYTLLSSEK
jgi:hypothetical protein